MFCQAVYAVADDEYLHRGTVTRDGDRWSLFTNSRKRFAELREIVLGAAADARLLSESTQSAHELTSKVGDRSEQDGPFATSPDIEVLREGQTGDEYMWLEGQRFEEKVPALGDGVRPRRPNGGGGR